MNGAWGPGDYFWERVSPEPNSGCWLWTGAISGGTGYGGVRFRGSNHGAHRVAYELARGPIPAGLELDHLCRVRSCVNPAHLEPVSHAENIRRGHFPEINIGVMESARRRRAKDRCPQGHPYDAVNTKVYQGRRYCRACHLVHSGNWKAKQ